MKKQKSTRIPVPEDFSGSMMPYHPIDKKETERVAKIIAKHKASKTKKQTVRVLAKLVS